MEINILENSKEEIKVEIESLTLAEILRVYLNKDASVTFVAWKRDHPTKKPNLLVKAKDAKKAITNAVTEITKDLDKFDGDFKKLK
jgi:DNA-directed RNA polymerase subunit L